MTILLILATSFLAYSNGANDNFKGVASLYGSRTTSYRVALAWATVTTFAGSIVSIFLAQTLLARFSGKGLVPDQVAGSEYFLLAVALGAGGTVIAATLGGLPVSTTHALTGAIIGSGSLAIGSAVNPKALGQGFLLPLLLSPLLAVVLAAPLYLLLGCTERSRGTYFGFSAEKVIDRAHFLSAGLVSFARGLNDTPKIAAMLLVINTVNIRWGVAAIAVMMALGGILNAKKVAETMSLKITSMNHGQGFAANAATGVLVILASKYGLPVSTTHVSVGALFGVGLTAGKANVPVFLGIALSWLLTLPCATLLAGAFYWLAINNR